MASAIYTIILKALGHHDEGIADATIYPGEAVRLAADGKYDPETLSAAEAARRGLKIAKEDALQGKTITQAYAAADVLFFYSPIPGDHIHALVKTGEDINIGDFLGVEGSGSGKFVKVSSAATAEYPLPITSAKVHDAMATNLPATAANDDMAIITGIPGTDAPTLQGVDFGGTSTDEKCAFEYILPPQYRAGSPVTIRLRAAMLTTVSDGTATVDVNVYKPTANGAVGADLVETAAQSINSLTPADKDFVVTPTGFVAGDRLIIRLAFAGSDTGNVGVMIPEISKASILIGDSVAGQLEALEDSGGALAAATHIKCRVLAV